MATYQIKDFTKKFGFNGFIREKVATNLAVTGTGSHIIKGPFPSFNTMFIELHMAKVAEWGVITCAYNIDTSMDGGVTWCNIATGMTATANGQYKYFSISKFNNQTPELNATHMFGTEVKIRYTISAGDDYTLNAWMLLC